MNQLASAAFRSPNAGSMLIAGSFAVLLLGYFYIFWDRRKDGSLNAGDGQVGIKLVLYTLLLVSLGLAVGAIESILGYILAAGKDQLGQKGAGPLKMGIASLVAGGVGVAAIMFACLPLTNVREYPQVERFAVGAVALVAGLATVLGLQETLQNFFGRVDSWAPRAHSLASFLVSAGLAALAMMRFGSLSGWQSPARAGLSGSAASYQPQAGYQQPQVGYQQPGGYSPQQPGGYPSPQQGGGYPQAGYQQAQPGGTGLPSPQGSGYPPPQGGGYPSR
ncbi:MAG TPA: hypothetical protein VNM90_22495 [Haliangium sp.]|nr:hypothetical protein [Haliangium sp.]